MYVRDKQNQQLDIDKCYQNNEWIWGYRENDPMGGHDPYSASKGCSELIKRIAFLRGMIPNPAEKAEAPTAEELLAEEIRKARLKAGVSVEQAQSDLATIAADLSKRYPILY